MAVIGIVSEYNPFHLGHQFHIRQSRAALGEDSSVVCVLSGDFVQRGEAAVYPKYARAEAACRCGADLAVELPLPWCLSSAEGFARGAVSLLAALGATHLSFGSETGDLLPLEALARLLLEEELVEETKALLARDASLSFAAAREIAAAERLGEETAALLRQPNNILAVEYLKAIHGLSLPLTPLAIARQGAGHDQLAEDCSPLSASRLRQRIRAGAPLTGLIPEAAEAVYARERAAGRELADPVRLELALLSRLRMLPGEVFDGLPDAGGGLGRRLWQAVSQEVSVSAILERAKTKRYPLARLRRMLLCAALGIKAGMAQGQPPYARVLAATERGRALLRERNGSIPLLTKPGAVRAMSQDCQALFTLGAQAHDFYTLGYPVPAKPEEDWRTGPVIL